ncbi:hypothetical protein EAE96_008731 [Botrytis aclada]|nr:hypothetical protein EAE96_008731 [Botrytis aclada]
MRYPLLYFLLVLISYAVTILIIVAPRTSCNSTAKLYNHMFATSNADFPLSILPTVYLPISTVLSLPIVTYGHMTESPDPSEVFNDEAHTVPATNSSSSSSAASAHFAFVLNYLPLSKGFKIPGYVFSDVSSPNEDEQAEIRAIFQVAISMTMIDAPISYPTVCSSDRSTLATKSGNVMIDIQ